MQKIQNDYRSYLLRIWRAERSESPQYCATLENVQTGELHGFACLEELVGYLKEVSESSLDENAAWMDETGCLPGSSCRGDAPVS